MEISVVLTKKDGEYTFKNHRIPKEMYNPSVLASYLEAWIRELGEDEYTSITVLKTGD